MLVSKNWLEQFTTIPKDITPEKLGEDLTLHVVEVEGVIDEAQFLDKIVLGRVASVQDHPNADTLKICTVEFGEAYPAQVVCGGSNVGVGILCAFAMLGARVRWHGEGDLVEMKKAKIRGVESYGMICAAEEIGLGHLFPQKSEKEILDLTKLFGSSDNSDVSDMVGKPLADVLNLNDVVFDIDNKSMTHRPDLWGHYGMAREVSAIYGQPLKEYAPAKIKTQDTKNKIHVSVEDVLACPRYMAVAMDGIVVGESPALLKKKLMSVGIQPKNTVVDVTNYVMCELGQPMHAFDMGQVTSDKQQVNIIIRKARGGERFISLDGKEFDLTEDDLVIADEEKVLALAGVKGSSTSGVTNASTSIVLESANFDAVTVRRTATRHGLRTDASSRFEKSLDPHMCDLALRRAVELLKDVCPHATVSSTVIDQAQFSLDQGPIILDTEFVRKKMGADLKTKEMVNILERLGFGVKVKKEVLHVAIPTWRATKDISIPEDLIEEIARIYGYDTIEPTLPTFPIDPPVANPLKDFETTLREFLAYECGYTEVSTYSFVSPELLENVGENAAAYIKLENPIAKDRPYLRRHLVDNMLEVVESNLHRFDSVRVFEIGKVFHAEEKGQDDGVGGALPTQDTLLAVAYAQKGNDMPFPEVATSVASVFARLGVVVAYKKKQGDYPLAHPGRYGLVTVGGSEVGHIAEVHPLVAQTIGLDARTVVLEVNLNSLLPYVGKETRYQPLPQYPSVERDVACIVPASVAHADIASLLIEADDRTVDVALFDVYVGDGVEVGKKSMAYRITYRSDKKTLTGEEVDEVHERILKMLEKTFGAEIR